MKKILVILSLAVLASAISVAAACPSNVPVANGVSPAFTGLSATPANVSGMIWVYTAGNPTTAVGTDYGTMLSPAISSGACDAFNQTNMLYYVPVDNCGAGVPTGTGYMVITDWNNASFDGCPAAASRVVIVAEDNTGKYAVISRSANGTIFDNLDTVATQAVAAYPRIGSVTRTALGGGNVTFNVTLTGNPVDGLGAYAGGDAPAGALITGYEVYYQNAAAPPSQAMAGWTLCTNGTIAGATTTTATGLIAPLPGVGNTMYLMVRMTFESGFKANYGSVVYTAFGPTAASTFNGLTAAPSTSGTQITWTSGNESRVANYQIYWSPNLSDTFRAVGNTISAQGTGSIYNTNVRVVTSATTYYVKVRANMTDGSYEWSPAVVVKTGTSGTKGGGLQSGTTTRR